MILGEKIGEKFMHYGEIGEKKVTTPYWYWGSSHLWDPSTPPYCCIEVTT